MEFLKELEGLKAQTNVLSRGRINSLVETKIRNNVYDIMTKLFTNAGPQKFLATTKLMYRDWTQELSEDVRFGREESVDKAMIKLSTFEWILSLPSIQKLRELEKEERPS